MTNDEIKSVIRRREKIAFDGVIYDRAQAWRVTWDERDLRWRSSLELISGNTMVVANADDCDVCGR